MTGNSDGRSRDGLAGPRAVVFLASLVIPVLCLVGCNSLNFLRPRERATEKIDRPAAGGPPTLPGKYTVRVAPYVFLSDVKISKDQPLFEELGQLRDQVQKELLLPPGTATVQVYLFETRDRYERYLKMKHPELPPRRAFFIAQPRSIGGAEDLIVYTYWGERIRQDLRHELTHALLHSVIRDVPIWLDEGLAEYFELPPEQKGKNDSHVEVLLRKLASDPQTLNLARLEKLREVDEMNPAEYQEAWAWVHLMLHSSPEARTVLLSYLVQLRGSSPGPLGPKLEKVFPEPEKTLANHLRQLEAAQARARAALDARR